ncbi:hypothetical protein [Desulfonatronum parangueonense]
MGLSADKIIRLACTVYGFMSVFLSAKNDVDAIMCIGNGLIFCTNIVLTLTRFGVFVYSKLIYCGLIFTKITIPFFMNGGAKYAGKAKVKTAF